MWKEIGQGFGDRWQFPGCISAIDGKHCNFRAPPNSGSLYFNYKKTFSLVLLAMVDHKYQFVLVDVGAFGSASDAGIFSRSKIGRRLAAGTLNIPEYHVYEGVKLPYVIVGDAAFPLRVNMMRPFPGTCLPPDEDNFNQRLSRARRISENAFARLTNRFQLYNRTVMMMPQRFKTVILATIILHNFIEKTRRTDYYPLPIPPEWIRRRRNRASANNVPLNPPLWYGCHGSQQAIEVRNTYTRLFHAERET